MEKNIIQENVSLPSRVSPRWRGGSKRDIPRYVAVRSYISVPFPSLCPQSVLFQRVQYYDQSHLAATAGSSTPRHSWWFSTIHPPQCACAVRLRTPFSATCNNTPLLDCAQNGVTKSWLACQPTVYGSSKGWNTKCVQYHQIQCPLPRPREPSVLRCRDIADNNCICCAAYFFRFSQFMISCHITFGFIGSDPGYSD